MDHNFFRFFPTPLPGLIQLRHRSISCISSLVSSFFEVWGKGTIYWLSHKESDNIYFGVELQAHELWSDFQLTAYSYPGRIGLTSFRLIFGSENSRYFLKQSDAKLRPIPRLGHSIWQWFRQFACFPFEFLLVAFNVFIYYDGHCGFFGSGFENLIKRLLLNYNEISISTFLISC